MCSKLFFEMWLLKNNCMFKILQLLMPWLLPPCLVPFRNIGQREDPRGCCLLQAWGSCHAYFLLQCTTGILPEEGEPTAEAATGNISDSMDSVLLSFAEMNKLWVWKQHQWQNWEREKREQERQELRILAGRNLVCLSQPEGIHVEHYRLFWPAYWSKWWTAEMLWLRNILWSTLFRFFPEEFHLQTLDPFLWACAELHQYVNVKK